MSESSPLPLHHDAAAFVICQDQQYIRWLKRADVSLCVCVCPAVYSILFSHQCVMSCEHIRLPAKLQPSAAQCPAGRGQDSEGITKKEWRAGFG